MTNILIIGDKNDPHIASVVNHLKKKNATVIVINPLGDTKGNITYHFSPFKIVFKDLDTKINHTDIDAVWWRIKPNLTSYPNNVSEFETNNFVYREWQLTLEPLFSFLEHCFWINRRSSDKLVRNKPYQLFKASQNGFKIPKTLISNDYNSIQESTKDFNRIIYKPLSYFIVPPDKVLYSNIMSIGEILDNKENIKMAPCIFQNYIDKKYELRITIVGSKIFAVKINSQENELAKYDWRRNQLNLKYEIIQLDKIMENKILALHNDFKLTYGAYDFIVDKNGDFIFLEVNPAGQWLWFEKELKIDISEQIATELIEKTAHNNVYN